MRVTLTLAVLIAAAASGCGDDRAAPPPQPAVERPARDSQQSPERAEPAPEPTPEPEHLADAAAPDAGLAASPLPPGKPMLLEFTRDHCLPCDIMAPWMKELRKEHAARVQIVEINIDRQANKPLARYFKARSIPTQVYVDERGREVSRHVGLATKAQMRRTMKRHGFLGAPRGDHREHGEQQHEKRHQRK